MGISLRGFSSDRTLRQDPGPAMASLFPHVRPFLDSERRDIAFALHAWEECRGSKPLPNFKEMTAEELNGAWPFAFILDLNIGGAARSDLSHAVITYSGEALFDFFGHDPEGLSPAEGLPRAVWERLQHVFDAVIEQKRPLGVSDHYTLRDGREGIYRSILLPLGDEEGNLARLLGVIKFKFSG